MDLAIDLFVGKGNGFRGLRGCLQHTTEQRPLVLSAYASFTAQRDALKAGADAFFDKPSQLDGLLEYCRTLFVRPAGDVYIARTPEGRK